MNSRNLGELIKVYLRDNVAGGCCHIVLSDNNLNDSDINFCIKLCREKNDSEGLFIMEQMLKMRKTARGKSIQKGYE